MTFNRACRANHGSIAATSIRSSRTAGPESFRGMDRRAPTPLYVRHQYRQRYVRCRPQFFVCCSTPYVSRVWGGRIDASCAGRNDVGLESVTQGLARATSHRVLAPAAGTSPRYSVPFFQNIAQDLRLGEHTLQCAFSVPEIAQASNFSLSPLLILTHVGPSEVLKLKEQRGDLGKTECKWNSSVCGVRPCR
jgi:hypothetical protein